MSIVNAIVRLAAELPDPGNPSFPAICAGFGGFVGALVGYARRRPRESTARLMTDGSVVGFGTGFVCWLVVLTIDRL
jgi:hypothetical protein